MTDSFPLFSQQSLKYWNLVLRLELQQHLEIKNPKALRSTKAFCLFRFAAAAAATVPKLTVC